MNVFIGGSRAVSKLNAVIRERFDDFMKRGCTVLVGDANGADKAVQTYFASKHYTKVIVFCMEECRNNVGGWPTRNVRPPGGSKGFNYFAAKDFAMAEEAHCGVMLWDAKSKGTLQNLLDLIAANKRTLVYFAPTKSLHVLANRDELQTLLARCEKRDLDSAVRALGLKAPLDLVVLPLTLH